MKVSFYNVGCKVNFAEISQIQEQFVTLGHEVVEFGMECDAVIINTCTVTKNADADCRKIIRRAHRNSPDAFIGVVGCYAQLKYDEIIEIEGVGAIFGNKEKFRIPEIIENFKKQESPAIFVPDLDDAPFHSACSADNESHTRVVLKIQDGCDYVCSYCAIPQARGRSRSMDFAELERTFLELDKSDFHEIILSGINLGEYEAPTGENFTDVIKLIERLNLRMRLRISSIEPNLLTDEIIDMVSKSKTICPHFHIPLQSGSAEVLKLMRRRYKVETFEKLVRKIKDKIPDCCIGADVIAGFPGETDELFEETYNFLDSLPISYIHAFTYSVRDNTPAASYSGKVLKEIKKDRTNRLRNLSERKTREFYESQVGSVRIVVPETENELNGNVKGWTENYVRVEYIPKTDIREGFVKVSLKNHLNGFVLAEEM